MTIDRVAMKELLEKGSDAYLHVLSMGSAWMIKSSQAAAGIEKHFANIITTEQCQIYKPHPSAYALGVKSLGLSKSQIGFVSGNSFDVIGARNFGFLSVWVRRHDQPLDGLGIEPDLIVKDLNGLADVVDCAVPANGP